MHIEKIDSNFQIPNELPRQDIRFYDVQKHPMEIYGVFYEGGRFRRMPENVASEVSEGVLTLSCQTAGGRVRFSTDSPFVAIAAQMDDIGKMPHFAISGSAGFDVYETVDGTEIYRDTFVPPFDMTHGYQSLKELGPSAMRTITIHFPLYSGVQKLWIGLQEHAKLAAPVPYIQQPPIVYYGSSITQGGCASRPGNSYQAILSRRFHVNHWNLGFSGSAKGEKAMSDYLAKLPMSVFVLDYDHNAPSVSHLENTHERMYQAVRKTHPNIPIIMMSRPQHRLTDEEQARLEVIQSTFRNARENGDPNVYLLTGAELTQLCGDNGTVDNCHPNDFGFASMARALGDLIDKTGVFR